MTGDGSHSTHIHTHAHIFAGLQMERIVRCVCWALIEQCRIENASIINFRGPEAHKPQLSAVSVLVTLKYVKIPSGISFANHNHTHFKCSPLEVIFRQKMLPKKCSNWLESFLPRITRIVFMHWLHWYSHTHKHISMLSNCCSFLIYAIKLIICVHFLCSVHNNSLAAQAIG